MSLMIALAGTPGLLGTQEAIRQSQAKEKREEHRARRCNLVARCIKSSARAQEINGRPLVLRNGSILVDAGALDGSHQYAGYYLPYPDTSYEGLVTTITDVAPIMNWVYVDAHTYQLRYGVRKDAQPNLTGPFDCTRQDRRLTFQGWEGFCVVEVAQGIWAVFFDVEDNGLRGKVPDGTRVLEIELERKEKRWKKDAEARMQDQTTNREEEVTPGHQEVEPLSVSTQEAGPQSASMQEADTSAPIPSKELPPQQPPAVKPPVSEEALDQPLSQHPTPSPVVVPTNTLVRVEPPVILSSTRVRSKKRSQEKRELYDLPPLPAQRIEVYEEKHESNNKSYMNLIDFTKPVSVSLDTSLSGFETANSPSRVRSILRRFSLKSVTRIGSSHKGIDDAPAWPRERRKTMPEGKAMTKLQKKSQFRRSTSSNKGPQNSNECSSGPVRAPKTTRSLDTAASSKTTSPRDTLSGNQASKSFPKEWRSSVAGSSPRSQGTDGKSFSIRRSLDTWRRG